MPVKKIKLGLREKYFDLLKDGIKIADGRLFKNKFEGLKEGDILEYYKNLENGTRTDEKQRVKVKSVNYFSNIDDLLKDLKIKNLLPNIKTKKLGKEIYEKIYGNKLKNGKLIGFTFEKTEENVSNKVESNKIESNKVEIVNKSNKPKTYDLYIRQPWFTLIKEGFKEVEGRLYKGEVKDYKIGDTINIINKNINGVQKILPVEITKLTKYPDFKSLLYNEKLFRVLPGFPSIRTGNELYEKIYPHRVIKENGALAITFKILGDIKLSSNNKEIKKTLKKEIKPNLDIQVAVNNNQILVNNQQKILNETLDNSKDIKETINSNTEMLIENSNELNNKSKLSQAIISSNQIAINANQNKVNDKQLKIVKKKLKNKL